MKIGNLETRRKRIFARSMGHLAFTAASLSACSTGEGSQWSEWMALYRIIGTMNKKMTKNNPKLTKLRIQLLKPIPNSPLDSKPGKSGSNLY